MTSINPLSLATSPVQGQTAPARQVEDTFRAMLRDSIGTVATAEEHADRQVQELHAGGSRDLHEVMIAMEQADISLRLLVQVRNKALEAYQEIMRIQV